MSELVYPATPRGLTFTSVKRPGFSTLVQLSPNRVSTRVARRKSPVWRWQLVYNYLYDQAENLAPGAVYTDFKTLMGFFLSRLGRDDNFLFTDPDDNHVELGALPLIESGGTFYSPVQRVLGGFAEDIQELDPNNDNASIAVWANGVAQPSGWALHGQDGHGLALPGYSYKGLWIEWDDEPEGPITATFDFYFRVRFDTDEAGFEKFMDDLWVLGGDQSKLGGAALSLVGCRSADPPRGCEGGTPTISSFEPPFIPEGSLAFTLTIHGSNFRPDAQVLWGGSPRAVAYISATELQVSILESDVQDPGTFNITVTNPSPGCPGVPTPYVVKPVIRFATIGAPTTGFFTRLDWTTFEWQEINDPTPQRDATTVALYQDPYTNQLLLVDSLLPAYLVVDGPPVPAVNAWGELDSTGDFADGEEIFIDPITYTIRTALSVGPIAYEVLQGADASETFANLLLAIDNSGTPGVEYSVGTVAHPTVGGGASSTGPNYIYLEARTAGLAGNAITTTTTAANAAWELGTFQGGLDESPAFLGFWTGSGACALSPNAHLLGAAWRRAAIVGASTFTGSGPTTLTASGAPTGKFNTDVEQHYTITINGGGTTFNWSNDSRAGINFPVQTDPQELDAGSGVFVTFSDVTATPGDRWTFTGYPAAVRLQVWDLGYRPTLADPALDNFNGPTYYVEADLLRDFDYPFERITQQIAYPAFPNVQLARMTGSLQDGGLPDCDGSMPILSFSIRNGGAGFTVGDNVTPLGLDGVIRIDTVDGSGKALTGTLTDPGTLYVSCIGAQCTGGTGTGLLVDLIGAYNENFNFGTQLTSCDCTQFISRGPIDLEVDDDGMISVLDLDQRGGAPDAAHNCVAPACEASHGQVTWPVSVDGEVSELTWDQVNLARLPLASTELDDRASWLVRYRVPGNYNIEDINDEPTHTSRIRYGTLTVHSGHGGSGYAVNDLFQPDGATVPATGRVASVGAGVVTAVTLLTRSSGWGYVPNYNSFQSQDVATTAITGGGTGLKVDFTLGGPVHTTTRGSTQYRELLAAPRIWDATKDQIVAIADPTMDFDAFLTAPLRTSSVGTTGIALMVPNDGGADYLPYDTLGISNGAGASGVVISVDPGTGEALEVAILGHGTGCSLATGVATTTAGAGTGLTVDILQLLDGLDGQITYNGVMSVLGPSAIGTLHYQDSSDPTYFDKLLPGLWSMDLSSPAPFDNPDPDHIGQRPYQVLDFVDQESVASQPIGWQSFPVPTIDQGQWQWNSPSSIVARSPSRQHTTVPYNRIDSGDGSITGLRVLVQTSGANAPNTVVDPEPSGHALQSGAPGVQGVCSAVLTNAAGWSALDDINGSMETGYRTFGRSGTTITVEDDLEPCSPGALTSDTILGIGMLTKGGILAAAHRRPS